MSVFQKPLFDIAGGMKSGVGSLFGTGGGRAVLGAGIGAAYGGFSTPDDAAPGTGLTRAIAGAGIGAGLGALTFRRLWGLKGIPSKQTIINESNTILAPHLTEGIISKSQAKDITNYMVKSRGMAGNLTRKAASAGKAGLNVGKGLGKFGLDTLSIFGGAARSVGEAALRNPTLALGGVATAAAMYGIATSGNSARDFDPSNALMASGVSSAGFDIGNSTNNRQQAREMFNASTFGLVQGMHQGRH